MLANREVVLALAAGTVAGIVVGIGTYLRARPAAAWDGADASPDSEDDSPDGPDDTPEVPDDSPDGA